MSNYRLRNPLSREMFIARLEQMDNIWNELVELMFNPIESSLSDKDHSRMLEKGNFIKEQLELICEDPFSYNNRHLNKLAYIIVDFARWCFNKKTKLSIITHYYDFKFGANRMMIKIDNEDTYYLGVITPIKEPPSFF